MNAPHEEAVEFAKESVRERRVYVGNLSYDTKYRDLIEFMRGGGLGTQLLLFGLSLSPFNFWADVCFEGLFFSLTVTLYSWNGLLMSFGLWQLEKFCLRKFS
jgi:hypothetical protein